MSHTVHARGGYRARYRDHHVWFAKNVKYDSPALDARHTARAEIDAEVVDLDIARWDPEVLLWGGTLTTDKVARERDRMRWRDLSPEHRYYEDICEYYPSAGEWEEYISNCGCCDSGCPCSMRRYADEQYDDYQNGRWSDDPCDAGWVDRWLAGEVHDDGWYDHSMDDYYDGYDECGYWTDDDILWEEYDQNQARLDLLPADLAPMRAAERQAASTRGRLRSARRRS